VNIKFFVDNDCHNWEDYHRIYTIRSDQTVAFEITELDDYEIPVLFIEDYELPLTVIYQDNKRSYRTITGQLFRESFGLAIVRIRVGDQVIELAFEVITKKANAQQVEEMIRYLTQKQADILRICLSRTESEVDSSDPELILNTVEIFVDTLISCRLELQYHLRKRLIPIKQPAWKATLGNDIDPFDIIFNLDVLEPVLGEADVVVNGRSFAISDTEVTTLEPSANVKENIILLGGIYAMRRVITTLLNALNEGIFATKIRHDEQDYESLNGVLLRLTASSMQQRCQQVLIRLEEFIRYFEKNLGICYQGECRPIMTPFVRASRVYRRLFELLNEWYALGEPSLEGRHCLAKLRSVSKIYEFVALFKLIDYLYANHWTVTQANWLAQLEFIPSTVVFTRDHLKLTLNYETKIFPYNLATKHFDLVDMKHSSAKGEFDYWCPDFILRLDAGYKTVYLVFDAKYSSASSIKKYHLPSLLEKYFNNMAVYDASQQVLKQEPILSVIALFADKNALSPIYLANSAKYGIHRRPVKLPVVTGLSLLPHWDAMAYSVFDQLFDIAETSLNVRHDL
jgi:hypothetical protein